MRPQKRLSLGSWIPASAGITYWIFLVLILGVFHVASAAPAKVCTASPEKYYNEALAEKESGDLPAASLALRRALVLDPTLVVAQQQLQEVLSKMGIAMESSWQQELASHYAPEKIAFIGMILGWSTTFLLVVLFFSHILSSAKKPKRWRLFFIVLFFLSDGTCALGVGRHH